MATRTKKRGSIIIRVFLLLFSVFMAFYLGSLIKELNSGQQTLEEKSAYLKELELDVKEKSALLENGNDKDFIEKAAREKLGYVYPNERVYIDIVK